MTSIQQRLLEMLKELDAICRQNGITYYVVKNAAYYAWQWQEFANEDDNRIDIAIRPEQAGKFFAAVNDALPSGRYIDCLLNNPDFPGYYINYGDKNSLYFSLTNYRRWKYQGIFIRVHFLHCFDSGMDKGLRKKLSLSKKLWLLSTDPEPERYSPIVRLARLAVNCRKKLGGRQRTAERLFNWWCRNYSLHAGEDAHYSVHKKSFPLEYFGEPVYAELEGLKIPLPSDPEAYLLDVYGKRFQEELLPNANKLNKNFADVISLEMTYEEYLPQLEKLMKEENFWQNYDFRRRMQHKKANNTKIIKNCQRLVMRSRDRIELYRYYKPLKDHIMSLDPHREQDYEELCELMRPYRSAAWKYYKAHLGFRFDTDMEKCLLDLLRFEERNSYADKLQQLSQPLPTVDVYKNLLR